MTCQLVTVFEPQDFKTCNGRRSSLHYDPYQNLLCVVCGTKRVTLYPPSAMPLLYPHPAYSESANHSAVDFAHPDAKRHPLFGAAQALRNEAQLSAGDALFIPEGWWHQVDSKGAPPTHK